VSASDKPDTARGWRFIEKLLADEDVERLDRASDEDVERQMREQGVRAHRVPSAEELLSEVERRAGNERPAQASEGGAVVQPLRRKRWIPWLVAAAIGALSVLVVLRPRDQPDAGGMPRQEQADALRRQAFIACGEARWAWCERQLDEAKGLDPKGDTEPRVVAARRAIDAALHPGAGLE
jgi:hypothetical protein